MSFFSFPAHGACLDWPSKCFIKSTGAAARPVRRPTAAGWAAADLSTVDVTVTGLHVGAVNLQCKNTRPRSVVSARPARQLMTPSSIESQQSRSVPRMQLRSPFLFSVLLKFLVVVKTNSRQFRVHQRISVTDTGRPVETDILKFKMITFLVSSRPIDAAAHAISDRKL